MTRMLLGETQKDLAEAMREYFSLEHYTVQIETNGLHILECLKNEAFDVALIETALPGLDGIAVVRDYRAGKGNTPIMLLAGKYCSTEMQLGLDAGADSYVVKPFKLTDVAVQLRALLRRPVLRNEKILTAGDIAMNTEAGTVTKRDQPVHLHPMEFKLLQFLLRHPNQIFTTEAIFERVWQKDTGHLQDTVRTHIRTLRKKIDSANGQSIITTVRGLGYKTEKT
ncbi:MAG: response regulator transcription factor [Candidatus Melainabacteria bacterium]|nr:response regulator transcription factor [Candidatus Melainabacteria bacterium]